MTAAHGRPLRVQACPLRLCAGERRAAHSGPHLYEIPITLAAGSHRKPMAQMACLRGNTATDRAEPRRQSSEQSLFEFLILPRHAVAGVGAAAAPRRAASPPGSIRMLDLVMLAIGLGFFALSVGYTIACDRL